MDKWAGKHRYKKNSSDEQGLKEAMLHILEELIVRKKKAQLEILSLFGTIEYFPDYDHKKHR